MYACAARARRARARMVRVPCSLRRRGIYDFGREHESGTRSLIHIFAGAKMHAEGARRAGHTDVPGEKSANW